MKLNFRMNNKEADKCEYCGAQILKEPYVLEINSEKHYFCCSDCAEAWKNA